MVFSFFKKPPEKMPERPAVRPRTAETPNEAKPASAPAVDEAKKPQVKDLPDLDFSKGSAAPKAEANDDSMFDDDFGTWSDVSISVDQDVDPIDAGVEQVVVLFANGQDSTARNLLETFIKAYQGADGKRFWLMLFDLFQVLGDRAAYDKLGVEFVHACETSPPPWHKYAAKGESQAHAAGGARKIYLQGVLTNDTPQALDELKALIKQKADVLLDCGKLIGCDDELAADLTDCLIKARKSKASITLVEYEGFLKRLLDRTAAGEAGHEPVWRLLLEILQRHGNQDQFEEKAVDYAITFELSPPSWENIASTESKKVDPAATHTDDAYYLSGELKNSRFDELIPVLEGSQHPILDFTGVSRLDFVSAGQLVNRLASYRAQGKEITIRGPNRLVAELMAIVGLNKQVHIVVPKY